jgi:hypothetical protein
MEIIPPGGLLTTKEHQSQRMRFIQLASRFAHCKSHDVLLLPATYTTHPVASLTRKHVNISISVLGLVDTECAEGLGSFPVNRSVEFVILYLQTSKTDEFIHCVQETILVSQIASCHLCHSTLQSFKEGIVDEDILGLKGKDRGKV